VLRATYSPCRHLEQFKRLQLNATFCLGLEACLPAEVVSATFHLSVIHVLVARESQGFSSQPAAGSSTQVNESLPTWTGNSRSESRPCFCYLRLIYRSRDRLSWPKLFMLFFSASRHAGTLLLFRKPQFYSTSISNRPILRLYTKCIINIIVK
jgi:hypothetical protein